MSKQEGTKSFEKPRKERHYLQVETWSGIGRYRITSKIASCRG